MLRYFWNLKRKRERGEAGFTLIELVVVLAILGILIALAVPRYLGARKRAYMTEARNIVQEIKTLEWAYYQQYSSFVPFAAVSGGESVVVIGLTIPTGSKFEYEAAVPAGSQSVSISADGLATGTWDTISMILLLTSDGSSSVVSEGF